MCLLGYRRISTHHRLSVKNIGRQPNVSPLDYIELWFWFFFKYTRTFATFPEYARHLPLNFVPFYKIPVYEYFSLSLSIFCKCQYLYEIPMYMCEYFSLFLSVVCKCYYLDEIPMYEYFSLFSSIFCECQYLVYFPFGAHSWLN